MSYHPLSREMVHPCVSGTCICKNLSDQISENSIMRLYTEEKSSQHDSLIIKVPFIEIKNIE